jgi:hypothetical protein
MPLFSLIQYRDAQGRRGVALFDGEAARRLEGVGSVLELARAAYEAGWRLQAWAVNLVAEGIDLDEVEILAPIDHPDPAHLVLSGTGLTHLGSAAGRDAMHVSHAPAGQETDSMRMFRMGIEAGRPSAGAVGAQPEWFYKGNGWSLTAPGAALVSPGFALDAGEEPELAGIYWIAPDGVPVRLGFALANEFSDHVTERGNYLWLAHSKLRQASIGPELLLVSPPEEVRGTSRIVRGAEVIWERPFLSGERHMSHSIANLEHHHFKYDLFRMPGDLHVHFFGTSTLSFGEVEVREGDRFEIAAAPFRLGLRNAVSTRGDKALVAVREA